MKRSADQLMYENVEINFENALTGEIYELTDDVSVKQWPSTMMNSYLIEKFSDLTGICIYQVKLMYNDVVVDENKTLKGQFDITESVMIFKVIKDCNQSIDIKDLKWVRGYELIWDGWNDEVEEVWNVILPKVKKFNIELIGINFMFSDVARVRLYNGLTIYYNDENKAPYTLFARRVTGWLNNPPPSYVNNPRDFVKWIVTRELTFTINIEEF